MGKTETCTHKRTHARANMHTRTHSVKIKDGQTYKQTLPPLAPTQTRKSTLTYSHTPITCLQNRHTYTHAHTHTHICLYIHTYPHAYMNAVSQTHTHMHTHTLPNTHRTHHTSTNN